MRVVNGYGLIRLGKSSLGSPRGEVVTTYKLAAQLPRATDGLAWTVLAEEVLRYRCLIHEQGLMTSRNPLTAKAELGLLIGVL